jgi:N-6 DNA Methylase
MEHIVSFELHTLLDDVLGYDTQNPQSNYRSAEDDFDLEVAHLLRTAKHIEGFRGVYRFKTSSEGKLHLPERFAVCFAEAKDLEQAKDIHKKIWNLGLSPFLVILLPNQVRVYTSRDFDAKNDITLIDSDSLEVSVLRDVLVDFSAFAIDSGSIWKSQVAKKLSTHRKVDVRLLRNLAKLLQILVDDHNLPPQAAHSLIGKYVYIRYLWDREILSEKWLQDKRRQIDPNKVLGRSATKAELQKLVHALDDRFNGNVFPIDFDSITDEHVNLVASVFNGDEPLGNGLFQTSLAGLDVEDFRIYKFEYIPTETLSSIYELFLKAQNKNSKTGAYYTPEWLADYVLSEVNSFRALEKDIKILDPACGSGIFLVLAYQRLIEQELQHRAHENKTISSLEELITPKDLYDILVNNIYGVEIEYEACKVTEFSLILTLLNYVEPPQLHKHEAFRFPRLTNNNIFHQDFFNDDSLFWKSGHKFDWIVGNPPWKKLEQEDRKTNPNAFKWIAENKKERPVGDMKIEEAFSWRVTDKLNESGVVGIIHHATSLFNLKSAEYRKHFFTRNEILRVTNLSNFRQFLFAGASVSMDDSKGSSGATAPAATFVYRLAKPEYEKQPIIHYGPFIDNQIQNTNDDFWSITINESEINTISPEEAELGEFQTWKFALWGNHRDKQAISYLKRKFPMNLAQFCQSKGWLIPEEGPQLRSREEMTYQDTLWEQVPELVGMSRVNTRLLKRAPMFSIPIEALSEKITNDNNYLRRGKTAINLSYAPHIYLAATWNHIIFSEQDFVIPPRQIGISAGKHATEKDVLFMKALAAYLRSDLVTYYIFFNAPEWGTFLVGAKIIVLREVRNIPVPDFNIEQAQQLASLYTYLTDKEKNNAHQQNSRFQLQRELDDGVAKILGISRKLYRLAQNFVENRLPLDQGVDARKRLTQPPDENLLFEYALVFRDELDGFAGGRRYHQVNITYSQNFVECAVEIKYVKASLFPVIRKGNESNFIELQQSLRQQHSQSVYVQRSLRVFDKDKVYIYKPSRLIDWTTTQALNDATDLIGEVLDSPKEVVA